MDNETKTVKRENIERRENGVKQRDGENKGLMDG